MTEEIKTCERKNKALKKLEKFALMTGAVFVGTTLAILLSASILRPKCPPPGMMGPHPGIQRQLPPPPAMHRDFDRPMRGHRPNFHNKKNIPLGEQVKRPDKPPVDKNLNHPPKP